MRGDLVKIRIFAAVVAAAAVLPFAAACAVPEEPAGSSSDTAEKGAAKDAKKADSDKAEAADTSKPGMDDVKIDNCSIDPTTKFPSAKVTITNKSSKTSNYMVQVEFTDSKGTRLDEGMASTNNLAPKQVSKQTAQALTEASGAIKCKVTDVTRYAS
jgi:hypothetical protein